MSDRRAEMVDFLNAHVRAVELVEAIVGVLILFLAFKK